MSPEEWLKSQTNKAAQPAAATPMSPEEWLKTQPVADTSSARPTPQQPRQAVAPAPVPTPAPTSQGFNVLEASQAALARQQTQREAEKTAKKTETIPFDQLYKNPENLKKIEDYASLRFGKTGQRQPNESAAQYVDRFAKHMRFINTNEINYFTEQDWINNSKPQDVLKAGEAYALFDKTAGFLSKGGQNPLKAVSDYIAGIGSAPSTVASLGVGKAVTGPLMSKAMSQGLKKAVASKTGAIGIGAPLATETSTNVLSNVYSQKRELAVADAAAKEMRALLPQLSPEQQKEVTPQLEQIEKQVAEGINVGEAALTGAITAPISLAVEVGPLALAAKGSTKFLKGNDFTLNEILDARKKQLNIAKAPDALTGNKDADNVAVTTTNIYDGGDLLDAQGAPTAIAQMQVKNSLDKQADLIAASIWKQIPDTAPKPGEQTFEAVQRTLQSFDSLPDNVIKQSMEDAGTDLPNFLTRLEAGGLDTDALEKFSAMYGVSTSDAARTLQSKSVISRMINKLREVDPESAKAVDALLGKPDATTGYLAAFKGFVDRVDRNMITAMTTNMATVMRNAFGVGVNSTYGAAEEGLESLLFNTGRKLAGQMRGSPVKGDIGRGIYGAIDDTVDTWFYLGQQGLSKDITEEALKNNPMLMSKMLATAEEMKQTDLIAPVRILNTPAVLMDNYIRRAVFASSIDYHMRQTGLNLFDTMAQGKNIPIDILRKGVDDALEFTFSKTPTEGLGLAFVKGVELTRPLSTTVFPFARFLANATKWTWKHYNPGITAGMGAADMIRGVNMLRNGDEAGQALLMQGSNRIAQQATGAATLIAAYKYREENQDTPWNIMKSDDGTTVDAKYLFPLNVPLALADFYYKTANGNPEDFKTKDLIEALTGFKAVGTQGQMLDVAREAASSIAANFTGDESDEAALNKMNKASAEFIGAWLGRATVPLNQFSDLISAFDNNESMQRDIFVTQPGEKLSGTDIIGRSIQKGIPILKQALPEYQPATREKAAPRDTGPFKQMTGLALIPPKNEIETEIERLNIPYQAVFKTTGDKTVDSQARKVMAENIEARLLPYLQSDEYKNATREGQFGELKNRLSELQNQAKDIATKQSIQDYYDREQVPPIEQKKFEALDPKTRKATIELYKQQIGKSLTEDTDFRKFGIALELAKIVKRSPLAVQEDKPGFAAGGAVSKQALKKAGQSSLLDQTMTLLQQVKKDAGVPIEQTTPSPVMDQTANMLMGKKPVLPKPAVKPTAKPVVKPAETAPEPSVLSQTEEALPTLPAKTIEAPTPSKQTDEFDDIDYETQMYNEDPTLNMSYSFDDLPYADPSIAGKGVVGTPIDKFTSIGGIDGAINIVRKERTDAFDKLRGDPDFLDFDDSVLSTALAKYREKDSARMSELMNLPKERVSPFYAPEFDIEKANTDQFNTFFKIAKSEQKRLDDLRSRYKDRPPVTLFHGQEEGTKVMQNLVKKGFTSPQTDPRKHAEMTLGAPSFTKDPNLNVLIPKFGGEDVGAYGAVNFPYADYLYRRVNMPAKTYDLANKGRGGDPLEALSVYNRAISGTDDNAVPISLPKSYHLESEDMFIEADKLKKMGFERPASKKGDVEARDQITKAISEKDLTTTNLKKLGDSYETFKKGIENKRVSEKDIYKMYGDVRNLFKQELSRSTKTVSVTGGAGSRYVNTIRTLAEGDDLTVPFRDLPKGMSIVDVLTDLEKEMSKLAKRKGNTVLTEKAANIAEMKDLLSGIREQTVNKFGSVTPSSVKAAGYSKGKIPESKMGLATSVKDLQEKKKKLVEKVSREWEEDVIDNLKNQIENIDADIAAKKEAIGPLQSERSLKDQVMKLTDKFAKGGLASRR